MEVVQLIVEEAKMRSYQRGDANTLLEGATTTIML